MESRLISTKPALFFCLTFAVAIFAPSFFKTGLVFGQSGTQTGQSSSSMEYKEVQPAFFFASDEEAAPETPTNVTFEGSLVKIADVYELHLKAVRAMLEQDLLAAETYIISALESMQTMIQEDETLLEDRRFNELLRTVTTEYREFYGIEPEEQLVEGSVFEIQQELYLEDDLVISNEALDLPDDLALNKTDVPLVQNNQVNRHLMYYTIRRPEVMETWLERSEIYFPMMREIFKEEGTPEELIHLSMIESGLRPTARSWASAVGLWQFIQATGSMYGLDVTWWVDERRDPEKATRAAAQHLRDLYQVWGDWHLAMANYNISPRGLNRAIRAAGGVEDYWTAYPFLPRETRGYVPGFIAATMIATNPEAFGFEKEYGVEPYSYDEVNVAGLMPLEALAEAAGITTDELKALNPELLRWATPPVESYALKIPSGTRGEFMIAYNKIPKERQIQDVAIHEVRSGENLGWIARKYGTSVRALFETNEGLRSTIYPGQKIMVPIAEARYNQTVAMTSSSTSQRSSSTQQRAAAPANSTAMTYVVKANDTIGHIAEWYDVRASQIRGWNGIGNTIRRGQKLQIYVPNARKEFYRTVDKLDFGAKQAIEKRQRAGENIFEGIAIASAQTGSAGSQSLMNQNAGSTLSYTVRNRDTLIEIADSYGVTVQSIQQENGLRGTVIYPGQVLRIPQ
ncbi:MAG: LysM peptidoglycan-binding domain-containing protein [Bacteroidetes bacterium]|nr:LysM peptidoglycan-binding domain-containing protein [Bacteroidota bacterium]